VDFVVHGSLTRQAYSFMCKGNEIYDWKDDVCPSVRPSIHPCTYACVCTRACMHSSSIKMVHIFICFIFMKVFKFHAMSSIKPLKHMHTLCWNNLNDFSHYAFQRTFCMPPTPQNNKRLWFYAQVNGKKIFTICEMWPVVSYITSLSHKHCAYDYRVWLWWARLPPGYYPGCGHYQPWSCGQV